MTSTADYKAKKKVKVIHLHQTVILQDNTVFFSDHKRLEYAEKTVTGYTAVSDQCFAT